MSLSSCRAPNLLLHTTGCLIALVVDRGSTRDTLYTEQQIRTGIWQPVRLLGACDDRMMTAHIESSNIFKNHLKTLAGECLHIPGVRGRVIICPLDNVSPSRFLHIPASDIHNTAAINLWYLVMSWHPWATTCIIQERTRTLSLQQWPWRCISLIARGTDMKWHEVAALTATHVKSGHPSGHLWHAVENFCGQRCLFPAMWCWCAAFGRDGLYCCQWAKSATGPEWKIRWKIAIGEHQRIKSKNIKWVAMSAMCVPDRLAGSHRSSPDSQVHRSRRTRRTLNLCKGAMKAIPNPKDPGGPRIRRIGRKADERLRQRGHRRWRDWLIGWGFHAWGQRPKRQRLKRRCPRNSPVGPYTKFLVISCHVLHGHSATNLGFVIRAQDQGATSTARTLWCPSLGELSVLLPPSSQRNRIFPATNAAMPCHASTFDYQIIPNLCS